MNHEVKQVSYKNRAPFDVFIDTCVGFFYFTSPLGIMTYTERTYCIVVAIVLAGLLIYGISAYVIPLLLQANKLVEYLRG